jgi:membrane protein
MSNKAWTLAKCAVTSWVADRSSTAGAALAFYSAFSLAPLLVILLTIAGWIVGMEAASISYPGFESELERLVA